MVTLSPVATAPRQTAGCVHNPGSVPL